MAQIIQLHDGAHLESTKPEMKPTNIACDFCGNTTEENNIPVVNIGGHHICGHCINDCYDMIKETPVPLSQDVKARTPSKIVEFVSQYVIGQDKAKTTLALAIYNHYKRMNIPAHMDVEIQKSNILLIGPSGSGKTLLAQTIARFLDIPFAIADATSLSATGWVGDDVETILQRLIQAAGGDVKKAEFGIVLIDELDKTAKKSTGANHTKDPAGEGVQQALLKIIEGTKSRVPKEGGRKVSSDSMDMIDTTNILFICAGAFVDLEDIMQKNHAVENTGIGFGAVVEKGEMKKYTPEPEDLYQFGLLPELVGRLPVICTLEDLDIDALCDILVKPKNSLVKQFKTLVALDGADLVFSDEAIRMIAEMAQKRKTGARGLRSIVEDILHPHMFSLPDHPEITNITVGVRDGDIEVTCY